MAGILFEDIFDVKDIDPDGKKFERGNSEYSRFLISLLYGFTSNKSPSVIMSIPCRLVSHFQPNSNDETPSFLKLDVVITN